MEKGNQEGIGRFSCCPPWPPSSSASSCPFLMGHFPVLLQVHHDEPDARSSGWRTISEPFRTACSVYAFWYHGAVRRSVSTLLVINVIAFCHRAGADPRSCEARTSSAPCSSCPTSSAASCWAISGRLSSTASSSQLRQPLRCSTQRYGFWGLIILMCWQQIGYMMIIYIAGLAVHPRAICSRPPRSTAPPAGRRSGKVTIPHDHAVHHHLHLPDADQRASSSLTRTSSLTGGEPAKALADDARR